MSKATTLYVSMIVVFVAGLWGVMQVGRKLQAPHDISGTWAVVPPPGAADAVKTLAVAQSGRFVKVKVDGGRPIDLTLDGPGTLEAGRRLTFKNGAQEMVVDPAAVTDSAAVGSLYQFTLRGPVTGTYLAERDTSAVKKTDARH